MSDWETQSKKRGPSASFVLISGLVWLALGLFGLIFDPLKRLMIIIQLVLGSLILIYYVWLRSRQRRS